MLGYIKRRFSKDKYYYRLFHRTLGVTPDNIDLYKLALVHRSASVVLSDGSVVNNERLEFLGDAVLGAISAELVFINFPKLTEGGLTQLRAKIVSRESMNALAKRLTYDRQIIATTKSLTGQQQNILGDLMEAIIGALYLDQGYDKTSRIVMRLIDRKMNLDRITRTEKDFKSRVIEWAQKSHAKIDFQTTLAADHTDRNPMFQTALMINGEERGRGSGRNKKLSEQRAAKELFEKLDLNAR